MYLDEIDVHHKVERQNIRNGTINRRLQGNLRAGKVTLIRFYKTMQIPIDTYDSENGLLPR